jgi:hypothetical protein
LPWLLGGGLLLLALGGFAGWVVSRRLPLRERGVKAPVIERPRVVPPPAPQPEPIPERAAIAEPPAPRESAAHEPLALLLEPLRLSLTLMNASLAYRLEVANHGSAALEALSIRADMISAHASMTREQQLAGPGASAPTVHRIDRLEPGESRVVEGEFRLPFPSIIPIRQGDAALMLPLARFRAQAQGTAPVTKTFAVGQPGAGGLQPFRLDLGPRVYPQLVQRAFA